MNNRLLRLSLLSIVSVLASHSIASADTVKLSSFEAGAILVFTDQNILDSNTFSLQLAWAPFIVIGAVGLRAELGVTVLKNGLHNRFVATSAELRANLPLFRTVALEGGGGIHHWSDNNGGSCPAVTVLASVRIPLVGDRFYAGYSRVFVDSGVNEVRAGIGFTL